MRDKSYERTVTVRVEDSQTGMVTEFSIKAPPLEFAARKAEIKKQLLEKYVKVLEKMGY